MSTDDTISERVALVTGANRGIGLATAKALRDAGHKVAATYRSTPIEEDGIFGVYCDVSDAESVDQAFSAVEEELGPVTIVVSNAGITKDGLMLRMSEDDFTSVIDANLTGGFRVAKRAVKSMMKARFGRMVFISSIVGIGGQAGQANYAASKSGLHGLARTLAKEFASRNVTVNVVAPGPIETDMTAALTEDQLAAMTAAVPLGRMGAPHEIAAAVRFLASEDAGYITGTILPVDGGMAMG
ncbi:MAG: beta-ketoacyl-ACP reductase [Acidimicrobiales bacterium]|nr:MAG: beta-ketoacyl-ACP reductase [Acidimicrobiales bacterium]